MDETRYWMWLTMVFGVGSRRIWEAMCMFETAEEAYACLTGSEHDMNLEESELHNIQTISTHQAVQFLEQCRSMGVEAVGYSSEKYPHQLRHISNPPAVLFYKGNIGCLSGTKTITAVGTRNASEYSLGAAHRICGELASDGFVIVSGFAVGTDITAHLAAVGVHRPTACVLGCGADVNYPKKNFQYRDAVIENGGVFITEYPPGTPAYPANFPKRNRILAGLGRAAVVFEASAKSGSLITANLAAEQGRDVFCLPPADIFADSYSGNVELLRSGAIPLFGASDITDRFLIGSSVDTEIRSERYTGISSFGIAGREVKRRKKRTENENRKAAEIPVSPEVKNEKLKADKKAVPELPDDLTELQKRIAETLLSGPVHADIMVQQLDIDASELMMELTELEIMGIVRSLPGKMFEISR